MFLLSSCCPDACDSAVMTELELDRYAASRFFDVGDRLKWLGDLGAQLEAFDGAVGFEISGPSPEIPDLLRRCPRRAFTVRSGHDAQDPRHPGCR